MGGAWVLLSDGAVPDAALLPVVQGALDHVEHTFSPWIAESELNRINSTPPGVPVMLSAAFADVLGFALRLKQLSGGAFDPTVGGEVSATGFGPARKPVRRGRMILDGRKLTLADPVTLDLCAVAKGYGVDFAAAALRQAGARDFLLNVSGDLLASGYAPDGRPWRVALELPVPDQQVIFRRIPLEGALATSGTYRNQRDRGAVSHLIDGQTGSSVSHGLIAVSVGADSAMKADGWATALAVLGPERASTLARAPGLSVRIVSQVKGGFDERRIGAW